MENKEKKKYQSTKVYSDRYNKENLSVQLNRELLSKLRQHLVGKDVSVKSYIENLIDKSLE